MNWVYVAGLAAGALILIVLTLRAERKRMWLVVLLLDVPTLYLALQWIAWRKASNEAWIAAGLAAVVAGAWWFVRGRKLPPVTSDNIKVWGQEPVPKPRPQDVAAMQAEITRLREEKDKMEAELQRLKDKAANGNE